MPNHSVAIALGSNMGNRLAALSRAINGLRLSGFDITNMSRVWETAPWGVTDQPRFLNMCLCARVSLNPNQMLRKVKELEKRLGRHPSRKWRPREIDIDILLIDNMIIERPYLTIPHPLMQERVFVMAPLAEIAPDILHPILKKTARELLSNLKREDMEWIIKL